VIQRLVISVLLLGGILMTLQLVNDASHAKENQNKMARR
jgi:hypothetical protein